MSSTETLQQQQQPGAWSILSLVDELLLCIVDQIDSHEALCNLAVTCSRFQGLVEPYCWRSLLVTKGRHASRIALALNNRVERIGFIQDMAIRYDYKHEEGIENLGAFLANMHKLRNLTIESPCPNNGDWRTGASFFSWSRIDYTTLFETRALPMLTSFSLHGHPSESRKFAFGKMAIIFFHPTLRDITISCSDFNDDINLDDIVPEKLKSTPLQSLTLIECNVYVRFLDVVLSLPRALKRLSIGERLHVFQNRPSDNLADRTSHPLFLSALEKQADSLTHLTHNAGNTHYLRSQPQVTTDSSTPLRNFHHLEHLAIGFESPLLQHVHQSSCPDSLKTIKLSDHALVPSLRYTQPDNVLRTASDTLLKRFSRPVDLDILFNHDHNTDLGHYWNRPAHHSHRRVIYDLAKAVKARGSRLRIFRHQFPVPGRSFIPPYMYGEDEPVEELFYDSDAFWMFGQVSHQSYDEELLENPDLVDEFVRKRGGERRVASEQTLMQMLQVHVWTNIGDGVTLGLLTPGPPPPPPS
ncbi:hypothetical protein K504DRAFT_458444 [Pleomassaria siparia CBS 279.74]|uniref:F-box domain-containing protein n=1 Tax=Pleomassaria siparia CBS 279.74 TaxID=1314801 RepID=A0A6G1K5S3_9PLEO|nr:hypothetical protein K504DRAFT_458444 [Pleomassaria siparia CBS 279.74]